MPSLPVSHEDELPPLPRPGASPAEIRAALHPEYRDEFDGDYTAAIKEAAALFELSGFLDVVEDWRMRAWVTRDPDEHRRVVRRASQLLSGEIPPDDEPVSATEARVRAHT